MAVVSNKKQKFISWLIGILEKESRTNGVESINKGKNEKRTCGLQ